MKFLLLFFSVFFGLASSQRFEWSSERKLTWNDFKAPENIDNDESVAYSYTGISYNVTRSSQKISFKIQALFDSQKSWKKNKSPNAYILQHEQLHFDITELFARKIRKMIAEKIKKPSDFETIFKPEYQKIYAQYQDFQKKYDQETHHSMNSPAQEEYNNLVEKMLGELEAYQ